MLVLLAVDALGSCHQAGSWSCIMACAVKVCAGRSGQSVDRSVGRSVGGSPQFYNLVMIGRLIRDLLPAKPPYAIQPAALKKESLLSSVAWIVSLGDVVARSTARAK